MTRDGVMVAMAEVRSLVERRIRLSDEERSGELPITTGYCRGASAALVRVLSFLSPSGTWKIVGGCGEECVPLPESSYRFVDISSFPGGMMGQDGRWHGHFWVEGFLSCAGRVAVDLTADQFGYAQCLVSDIHDVRYLSNIRPSYEPLQSCERLWADRVFFDWVELRTMATAA